jgi:hypothetical protein
MSLDSVFYATETTFAPVVVSEKPYNEKDPLVSLRRRDLVFSDFIEAFTSSPVGGEVGGQVTQGRSTVLFRLRSHARLHSISAASSVLAGAGPDMVVLKQWRVFQKESVSIPTATEWISSARVLVETFSVLERLWSRTQATREAAQRTPSVAGLAEHAERGSAAWHVVTEAAHELRRRFPGRLELRVERVEYNDGGGPVGGELFFVIGTELDGAAAHDKLEAFMDEFWLDRLQAHPNLPIPTIELL